MRRLVAPKGNWRFAGFEGSWPYPGRGQRPLCLNVCDGPQEELQIAKFECACCFPERGARPLCLEVQDGAPKRNWRLLVLKAPGVPRNEPQSIVSAGVVGGGMSPRIH
jgi:hypothetical protein